MARLKSGNLATPNFGDGGTADFLAIALRTKPHAVMPGAGICAELTTEVGPSRSSCQHKRAVRRFSRDVERCRSSGVLFHLRRPPGRSAEREAAGRRDQIIPAPVRSVVDGQPSKADAECDGLSHGHAARAAVLEVHSVHGSRFDRRDISASLPDIAELNIGYYIDGKRFS